MYGMVRYVPRAHNTQFSSVIESHSLQSLKPDDNFVLSLEFNSIQLLTTSTMAPNPDKEARHNPEIYVKSGDVHKHLEGVKAQYDTDEKRDFYAQVMGDGTAHIHFGKFDNIDMDEPGAYGKASDQMVDYMYQLARGLLPDPSATNVSYVDLGSGSGGAAVRLLSMQPEIAEAVCVNLCEGQNRSCWEDAADKGVQSRIHVVTASYDETGLPDNAFDFAYSQDAFVHSFNKVKTYNEALRITKPGGVFVFCDIMRGNGKDVSEEELQTFAATNMVNDWLTPQDNCRAAETAGWTNVQFIDLTQDIRLSFQLMKKKVDTIIARGSDGIDVQLLTDYSKNLEKRVTQVDRGVFQWGVIHAQKKSI